MGNPSTGFCAGSVCAPCNERTRPAKALDASETVDLSWIDGMRKPYGDFENPKCQCKTCQSKNGWNACIDAITGRLKGAVDNEAIEREGDPFPEFDPYEDLLGH